MSGGEWVAVGLTAFAAICGGAGVTGVLVLIYKSGRGFEAVRGDNRVTDLKVDTIIKELNGPMRAKFDSVTRHTEEAKKLAQEAVDKINKLPCESHDVKLEAVMESVSIIKKHQQRNVNKT